MPNFVSWDCNATKQPIFYQKGSTGYWVKWVKPINLKAVAA